MRTFVREPKSTQPSNFAKSGKFNRVYSGQSRKVSSFLQLQRETGNQAVSRIFQSNSEELKAGSSSVSTPGIAHDCSQIPIHSTMREGSNHAWEPHQFPSVLHTSTGKKAVREVITAGPVSILPSIRGRPCPSSFIALVNTRQSDVESIWLSTVRRWFDAHLQTIRRRVSGLGPGRSVRVGTTLFRQLQLLNRHFAISRFQRPSFPLSASERLTSPEFESLGQASGSIRRNFSQVSVTSLSFDCVDNLPGRREGVEATAEVVPGSRHFTISRGCFTAQPEAIQREVVLHEAFHANFARFDHDSYFHQSSYPGSNPLTNADSYSSFAYRVVEGSDPRGVVCLPPTTVTGSSE